MRSSALIRACCTAALALTSFAHAATVDAVPASQPTTQPGMRAFDPARHMRTSEVRPGMKGYGLTVLSGTKIEKFDVEVISVLHDLFGPRQDVVMIRCLDDFMKHTGPIQGCSGSPIYLYDDTGKARLIGAYAYGFELVKEPIVGVQPIENMLTLPAAPADIIQKATGAPMSFSLLDAGLVPNLHRAPRSPLPVALSKTTGESSANQLSPLATPLAIRGVSQAVLEQLGPALRAGGFQPMLAMASTPDASMPVPKIEPGSVLAAQMLGGDLELTAVGTCTEVIDGRAYGFGHPFNGEGATSIPMGAGQIHLVMPMLSASFKLGSMSGIGGAIDMDGSYGIAGMIGATPHTIPIHVEVVDNTLGTTRTFNYQCALHRTYSPDLIAMALQASVLSDRALPLEHTASYEVKLKFAGNRELSMGDIATSLDGFTVIRESAVPIVAMMNNPFDCVPVESVTCRVQIDKGINGLTIETASPAQPSYSPGETARIHVRLRTPTGAPVMKTIDVPLPLTLAEGDATISIGDSGNNLELEAQTRPYQFTVRSVDELFAALTTLVGEGRSDAMYARLASGKEGLSIGRTPLPNMPPSRRAILAAAGRPETGALAESNVIKLKCDAVVRGTTEVTIHVKKRLP